MLNIKEKVSATAKASFSQNTLRSCLLDWPLYLILVISTFLHLFRLQTTEFDFDQANLFRLAHDAVAHGLLSLSSNQASINILNPPFFIYTLLPAAALSANPLGGAITVALFAIAADGLTYLFTRRYFGQLPAIFAGLLSATAFNSLKYSRGIWQPDILPFFVILFLFAIFRGAVDQKKGWFFPAVAFMAIIYQLHPSSMLGLGVLFILALLLAPATIRWRDIFLAAGALFFLFLPYGVLEVLDHFADIKGISTFMHLPAHNDTQALRFYQGLILPYGGFQREWMYLLGRCVHILLFVGLGTVLIRLFHTPQQEHIIAEKRSTLLDRWLLVWNEFRLNPVRVSCLLLLVWQIVPFANLLHHSIGLHMQYFLLFLPGPFILMGLSLDGFVYLAKRFLPKLLIPIKFALVLLSILLVIGQFVNSMAYLLKMSEGHYNDRTIQNIPYVNDLNSMWNAVHEADQLAQAKHISRIFLSMDINVLPSMTYLGEILHTSTTVFGYDNCLVLPQPEAGSAVYLVGPYADHIDVLLHQFTSATLVAQPQRLGGKPFNLYIVTSRAPGAMSAPVENFTDRLQLLEQNIYPVGDMEVTHWSIQRETPVAPRTLYNYQLSITPMTGAASVMTTCVTTSLHRNDQLLAAFPVSGNEIISTQQPVSAATFDIEPDTHHFGSIQVTTFNTKTVNAKSLMTSSGSEKLWLTLKPVLAHRPGAV
jgi:hypothetical protein